MTRYSSIAADTLIRACAESNDAEAWEEFVSRFQRAIGLSIIRTASKWSQPPQQVVNDLVQETYLKLCADNCRLLLGFATQHPEAVQGYIKTIAINVTHFQGQFWGGVPANVHPWNDCSGANALSLPTSDILYGVNLFQQLVAAYGGDAAPISGVLAHEWGHQVQFNYGWFTSSESTNAPIELEADAFSGYYMALGESYSWNSINDYFSAIASKGDYNFNDPNHHGTPEERLAAAQLGFQTAIQVLQTGTPLCYADLHQIFSTAIGGFAEKQVTTVNLESPIASQVLARLDKGEILDILKGASHGKDATVPRVQDKERLYPKKEITD